MAEDEGAKPKKAEAAAVARIAERRVKAKVRLENQAFTPAGEPKDIPTNRAPVHGDSWVVEEGEFVGVDHPAVAMHPTHFEGV